MVLHETRRSTVPAHCSARTGRRCGWRCRRAAADLYARAVRDHLADFVRHAADAAGRGDAKASIHVWFASYDGVRELLFPALKAAYAAWRAGDGGRALRGAIGAGEAHFTRLARQALQLHAEGRSGIRDRERC